MEELETFGIPRMVGLYGILPLLPYNYYEAIGQTAEEKARQEQITKTVFEQAWQELSERNLLSENQIFVFRVPDIGSPNASGSNESGEGTV